MDTQHTPTDVTASSLSIIAFGVPSDPGTFSGVGRGLTEALRRRSGLRAEYSLKPTRPIDLARCITLFARRKPYLRPHISRRWLWSRRGTDWMTRSLDRQIRANRDAGPFLQIGTLAAVDPSLGRHVVYTDMTIPQAVRAGQFEIAAIGRRHLDEAIALQAERLAEADRIFTFSQWAADSVVSDFGIAADRVTTVYAGTNLQIPSSGSVSRGRRDILFVGIDWQRKGGPLLLEAFERVRRRLPDATLTIVGCSPKVERAGVEVKGYLSRKDPRQFNELVACYARAACFCLPTLFDPFPNVIFEAASVSLPCVAIDNGSRREAIVHGQTGLLARTAEPSDLADSLIELLENPERAAAMGMAARQRTQELFTWDAVVDRIQQALAHDARISGAHPTSA